MSKKLIYSQEDLDLILELEKVKDEELQQENKQLKKELECTIGIVEHNRIISEKNKEIHQLKDNWNKLKEYLHNQIPTDKTVLTKHIKIFEVLDKMQELEQGSDINE